MVTDDQARGYLADPISFMEQFYVLPETLKPIKLEWWQKEYILKPLLYDLDDDGKRKYNIAIIAMPKKNGKSALGAGLGVNALFCWEPFGEIIIAANAKDQASMIIYNKMRHSVMLSPELKRATTPLRRERIEVYSTGTTARCVAHQYETAAGLNPNFTIFDELWGFSDRKFFDELTVVPTRPNPLIVVVTYAGYEEEGLLWDMYQDGMEGEPILDTGDPEVMVRRGAKDKRLFMFWSHKNLASWVTDEYLAGQRGRLPPEVYARLHENRWVSAGSQVITAADIARIHDTPWVLQTAPITDRIVRYVVATDLGLSHDRAARVLGHYDPYIQKLMIDSVRVWQGTPEQHVPIRDVEEDLIDCGRVFNATLVIDPWQMEYVIQRLKPHFPSLVAFNFSSDITHLSQALITAIRTGTLKSYEEPELDKELGHTIIRQTAQGWRVDHPRRKVNDVVIATGMVALEALRHVQWVGSDIDMSFYPAPALPNDFQLRTKAPDAMEDTKGLRRREF